MSALTDIGCAGAVGHLESSVLITKSNKNASGDPEATKVNVYNLLTGES